MTSRSILFSAAVTLAIVLSFSACGLQTGGLPGGIGGEGGTPLGCVDDSHCVDDNPCTIESCDTENGICVKPETRKDGPLPVELQTAGDCTTLSCKAGEPFSDPDDKDILSDDNDCTVDACSDNAATHVAKPDGSACLINAANGACNAGECVVDCGPGKPDCDDKEPCTTDACDAKLGKCVFIPMAEGSATPGSTDGSGNCKVDICVAGKAQILTDDSDTPSAENDCQTGTCTAGVPAPMFFAKNTVCSSNNGKFCDGTGTCVECNDNPQCGTDDDCNTFTCDAHACNVAFTAADVAIGAQTAKDCQVVVCDGAGKTKSNADNLDLPNDSNDCTTDICTAGVPDKIVLPVGTGCGNNSTCNLIGQCGCTDNNQCLAPQTCGGGNPGTPNVCGCTKSTCASLGKSCGVFPDGCGGTIDCSDTVKNGGETDVDCGGAQCSLKCAQGKICSINSDCSGGFCADGRCCDGACNSPCQACNLAGNLGTCSPIVSNIDNNPANACSGNNACDATGACKKITGQNCGGANECVSGFCADGRCCDGACTGTCVACNLAGKLGQCSNIAGGSPDNNATVQCNGTNTCDGSGVCKKINGQNCAASAECFSPNCVDGVCCNNGCGTTCQACNVAGSIGTCTNIPVNGTDNFPANVCNGNNACNGNSGASACKKINGQGCNVVGDCVSNFCADGVCCNGSCNAACRSCNLMGSVGTCTNITSGTDSSPANVCVAPNSCDAGGNCKKVNGTACNGAAECVSGTCIDGFCCGSASCPTCQACTGANGTCVDIGLGLTDTVPANTCTGNNACDGMGACKLKNGQGCGVDDTMCASGICMDTVCCNNACSLTCQACNIAGSVGTCTNITVGTDADTCTGTMACNAASQCKKNNGQACMAGSECLTGNCTDGTCCGSASCGPCQSCALNGNGTCSNIGNGLPDTNSVPVCDVTSTCNGAGACKKLDGQICGAAAECFNPNCIDGVCCNVACLGTCMACNVGGSVGTCTNVPVGLSDSTATLPCTGINACDGAGLCKLKNGQSCAGGASTCASGLCADLVCCDTACSGVCEACTDAKKGGGSLGVCGPIASGADPDDECPGALTCDGANMCSP